MDPNRDDQTSQDPQAPADDSMGGDAPVSTPPVDPIPNPAPDVPAEGGEVPPPPPAPAPAMGDEPGQPVDPNPAA